MMKSDEQYQVPVWMRPLLPLFCNTGGNDPEELLNDTETTASANIVRYVLIVAVRSQIDLLQLLYRKGLLRTEIYQVAFHRKKRRNSWIIWCAAISARRCRVSEWQPVTEMPI